MKVLFYTFFLMFGFFSLHADTSWTPPQTIPPQAPQQIRSQISYAYDNDHGLMYAAWNGVKPDGIFYCIYNDSTGSWGNVETLYNVNAGNSVQLSYISGKGQVIATWQDGNTNTPLYAIYDNGTWTAVSPIYSGYESYADVYTVYNPNTGTIFAAWQVDNSPYYPYYSVYTYSGSTGTAGSWSLPTAITDYAEVNYDVILAYDSHLQTVFAVYGAYPVTNPIYAIYDKNTNNWSAGLIDANTEVRFDVTLAYDPTREQMFAAWVDINTVAYVTYFSDSSLSWSYPPFKISENLVDSQDVQLSVATDVDQVFAAWIENDKPIYSIYNGSNWSYGLIVDRQIGDQYDVTLAYDSGLGKMFAGLTVGSEYFGFTPYYSTYSVINLGPVSLQGKQKVNSFGLVSELYNNLTWQLVNTGTLPLQGYDIYRNGVLIATLPPTQTQYQDHNRIPGQLYTYEVVPFNSQYSGISATIVIP